MATPQRILSSGVQVLLLVSNLGNSLLPSHAVEEGQSYFKVNQKNVAGNGVRFTDEGDQSLWKELWDTSNRQSKLI